MVEEKCCKRCQCVLPIDQFTRYKNATAEGVRNVCKACRYQQHDHGKAYRMSRNRVLKCRYGITLEDYERKLEEQSGRCAICETTEPGGIGTFHVDHDHKTGAVRDLLCFSCNTVLGRFDDNIELLEKAIDYLKSHKKEKQYNR